MRRTEPELTPATFDDRAHDLIAHDVEPALLPPPPTFIKVMCPHSPAAFPWVRVALMIAAIEVACRYVIR